MYFYVIFSDLKALFPLEYFVVLNEAVTEPNSAKPTTIPEWVRTESTKMTNYRGIDDIKQI